MIDMYAFRSLMQRDRTTATLMGFLATRKRHTSEMTVDTAMQATRATRSEVVTSFKKLAELNLGSLIVGRKGHKTRFCWAFYAGDIAKAAAGELDELVSSALPVAEVDDADFFQHTFQLRRDMEISVDLPSDLNEKEAARLARWIETLPFADD